MRIAIDAMGGDHAPDAILDGAFAAIESLGDDDRLTLIGDQAIIEEVAREQGVAQDPRIEIVATTEVIGMDETPTAALRRKNDSSIARWALLGSRKIDPGQRADVIISAGNTGACVAAAQMSMRRLPGVHRPGIAVTMPTFHGPVVLCDVGANIHPKPAHLHQYALMAGIFARAMHGIDRPRVAVLSVGGEEGKGTQLVKETSKLIRDDSRINYVGYVEGRELFDDRTDVIVTEGFTGNVVLKLAEGMAAGLFKTIAHEIFETDPDLAIRFEPIVKQIYKKHDYHEFGGAPLLGVNGICMVCHGTSEARTIRAAVRNSIDFANRRVNEEMVEVLAATTVPEDAA